MIISTLNLRLSTIYINTNQHLEKYKDLKKKAIGRGMSIGFFEMMSMGLTGKVSRKLIKAGKK